MITSNSRGHQTYYDGLNWRFTDNKQIDNGTRECKRCGRKPTLEGYDACLGHIEGATSACCGHGVEEKHIIR
ncbi:MAG: hypothetical protein EWM50_04995 [Gottschalkiaceae bacterium]|nr:MAG: hypothetical protein EWM50_04995 [Gottschalkiaceae bacterium]